MNLGMLDTLKALATTTQAFAPRSLRRVPMPLGCLDAPQRRASTHDAHQPWLSGGFSIPIDGRSTKH